MIFSSISFLYFFLPLVLLFYFMAPKWGKNIVLLLTSLLFYAWGEPKYVLLMIILILIGYLAGVLLGKWEKQNGRRKAVLYIAVTGCIGALVFFKYTDFFIGNVNAMTGSEIPVIQVALPIGISFYTFQIISYVADVYKQDAKVQKNPVYLATYITMFPQLIAGPIVRYTDVEFHLKERAHSFDDIAIGIRRFIFGLAKKVLIANQLAEYCEIFRDSEEKSILFLWVYAIVNALYIYFDFSGYSDMAIGLGTIFGFHFPENFNYPFVSKSITEFWRRWHISLGRWFRDYVYIPLGGNRVGKLKWLRNIVIVWFLTGFWHGAAWNFILWGLFFAVFLILEKFGFEKILKKSNVIAHIYVIFLTLISFILFQTQDLPDAIRTIGQMFGMGTTPFLTNETLYYLRSYGLMIVIACIGATPLAKKILTQIGAHRNSKIFLDVAEVIFLFVLLILITAYLIDGSFNPFLYFRF